MFECVNQSLNRCRQLSNNFLEKAQENVCFKKARDISRFALSMISSVANVLKNYFSSYWDSRTVSREETTPVQIDDKGKGEEGQRPAFSGGLDHALILKSVASRKEITSARTKGKEEVQGSSSSSYFRGFIKVAPFEPNFLFSLLALDTKDIVHAFCPGNYEVEVSNLGEVFIEDVYVQSGIKAYLGVAENSSLTVEQCEILRQHIRYRDLSLENRCLLRKSLYSHLAERLPENTPVELPFKEYGGDCLTITFLSAKESITLSRGPMKPTIQLKADGNIECRDVRSSKAKTASGDLISAWLTTSEAEEGSSKHKLECPWLGDKAMTLYANDASVYLQIKGWENCGGMVYDRSNQLTTVDKLYHWSLAGVELLLQKIDSIDAFFSSSQEKMKRERTVFYTCAQLLASLKADSSPFQSSSTDAIEKTKEKDGVERCEYGPFWNSAIASEDSTFTFVVERGLSSEGEVSLQSNKQSSGRGMMGGTSTRKVIISTTPNKNELNICIQKESHHDIGSWKDTSTYFLRLDENGSVIVRPEGKQEDSEMGILFLNGENSRMKKDKMQTEKDIQNDKIFMFEVLATIADIYSHPETILLSRRVKSLNVDLLTMSGNPIPLERVQTIMKYRQGIYGAAPSAIHYWMGKKEKQRKKSMTELSLRTERAFAESSKRASSSLPTRERTQGYSQTLEDIAREAERFPFLGYGVGLKISEAASVGATPAIQSGKMKLTENVAVAGVGKVSNCYTWKENPSFEAEVPEFIQGAAVHLPEGIDWSIFSNVRKFIQQGVVTGQGISDFDAQDIALKLKGGVIEATMPYKAGAILKDNGGDVPMHYIFQTGLNFSGSTGGGIPIPQEFILKAAGEIKQYSASNAQAAVRSALRNGSDVLVFNLGIGTGFFGGWYGSDVKEANVTGLCQAVQKAKEEGHQIEVIVPNVGLDPNQKARLESAGIRIVAADKDAVAALCARSGRKVSTSIAGDPMSMLGIHGPGFWWETVGSASDEERAAFLSPCYALSHIPIDVYQHGYDRSQRIAALSEFMREELSF